MAEIPREFLSVLESDPTAMQRFAGLPDPEKEAVLNGVRHARSAQELAHIISRL